MSRRLPSGGAIDRARPVDFTFDGRPVRGFVGDTVASALLGAGIDIVGRSFKYHRPRGIFGHWTEEPNAILDIVRDGRREPNARATTTFLEPGPRLDAVCVGASPDAARDRHAFIDAFARFLPAGFYYKTFLWPGWQAYEPRIRAMAGLGRIDPSHAIGPRSSPRQARCDVLVVGGGPAGLAAAAAAVAAGRNVWLADDRPAPGGSLLWRAGAPDGEAADAWIARHVATLVAGGARLLADTTVYGLYDHRLAGLVQRGRGGGPDRIWHLRASTIVLAAGAIERPLVFAGNDRPGILSAEAGLAYLAGHGVLVGDRVTVATNNDAAFPAATALAAAGAAVTLVDLRPDARGAGALRDAGIEVRAGRRVIRAAGRRRVVGVELDDGTFVDADAVLVSGGFSPTVHLHAQARGTLAWDEALLAFVPDRPAEGMVVVGAADGAFGLDATLGSARTAMAALLDGAPAPGPRRSAQALGAVPAWPADADRGRAWVDLQSDVTLADVRLAARENYASVEHLKRYTTLGMATDQGKTSNVNGIAALAAATGRPIGAVGTTTYRPPFVPVSLAALAGRHGGELMRPLKRLALESRHRALGASFGEYGGWLRPSAYGEGTLEARVAREVRNARDGVAVFDASPLGKIEVMGPDAARFMDFNAYMTLSTLASGRLRYALMLEENGVVFDDGVVARLDEHRFLVSCSSGHAAAMRTRLDVWRQDQFDPRRIFVHDATAQWTTLALTGPRSRDVAQRLDLGVDLSDTALPHMALATGRFDGGPARVARVSFTGDRCYEVSVQAGRAGALLDRVLAAGAPFGVAPLGLEALMVLRAEKGHIVVGKDTDGTTLPHDLGFTGPRERRADDFIGKRSLFTQAACDPARRHWVGLAPAEGTDPLPCGAHVVVGRDGGGWRSQGFVTTSHASPTLGRPVALGVVERGRERLGETVTLVHLGRRFAATLVPACALDPAGERLHA